MNDFSEDNRIKIWENGYKGLHEFAVLILKSLILTNGAAVISLLTFIGAVAKSDNKLPYDFSFSFQYYLYGVISALISAFGAYIFLLLEFDVKWSKAVYIRFFAMFFAMLSLFFFYLGSSAAINAIN